MIEEAIKFIIENRAALATVGSAFLGLIIRRFEKKAVVRKYENIISGMNGVDKH